MWDFRLPTSDWTHTSCFGRQVLNHWTRREVPEIQFRHIILKTLHLVISSTGFSNKRYIGSASPEMWQRNTWIQCKKKQGCFGVGVPGWTWARVLWSSQARTRSQRRLPGEGKAWSVSWHVNRCEPGKEGQRGGTVREDILGGRRSTEKCQEVRGGCIGG